MKAPVEIPQFQGNTSSRVNTPAWLQYYQQQEDYYQRISKWADPMAVGFGEAEPPAALRIVGLLAYADGVNWKPNGVGLIGYWRWNGASWVRLG